tara:strand:- start:235 stop:1155 length:921 start_codon:yes stop_codon:yes gene_type:complete
MAATLSLDTITSSGSTITVPTGKTLVVTDAAGLTVAGTTIESGNVSVNTITAASTDLGTAPEVAMWTGKNKAIFMVDASGGARTVQLPAANATGRSTVSIVISCKATSAVPATVSPNLVTINNSSGSEVFTLYAVGDYVEFVSDGTNDLRTGNEHISAKGFVFRNANEGIAIGATENLFQVSEFTIRNDWGGWFNSTNFAAEIPFACRVLVECLVWGQDVASQHVAPSIKRFYSSRASDEYIWRTDNKTASPHGSPETVFIYDFAAGDEIEYSAYNLSTTTSYTLSGGANGWYQGCYAKWTVLRRY